MAFARLNTQVRQGNALERHYHWVFVLVSAVIYERVGGGRRVARYGQWPMYYPGHLGNPVPGINRPVSNAPYDASQLANTVLSVLPTSPSRYWRPNSDISC
jgi:hypothetical protein